MRDIERALMNGAVSFVTCGAPDLDWERWRALQKLAAAFCGNTTSPPWWNSAVSRRNSAEPLPGP